MNTLLPQNIKFNEISQFNLTISRNRLMPLYSQDSMLVHNHMECEIYVHISGNATFWVENNIYPLTDGDIIISRPHEKHHIIFQNDKVIDHYWILFSCADNENLYDRFFKRDLGENNLIQPNTYDKSIFLACCEKLHENKLSDFEKIFIFFKIIDIITNSKSKTHTSPAHPPFITAALDYITANLSNRITVEDVALNSHVSISSLERGFKKFLGLSPNKYILTQRLSLAEKLLREGESVSNTALKSGFPDCSGFIQIFKKHFGMTPFKYARIYSQIH